MTCLDIERSMASESLMVVLILRRLRSTNPLDESTIDDDDPKCATRKLQDGGARRLLPWDKSGVLAQLPR